MSPSWKEKAIAFGKVSKKMPKDVKIDKKTKPHNRSKTIPSPYVRSVLQLYTDLPHTPRRPSQDDRSVAQKLQRQHIPLRRVQAALLLGSARRLFRVDSTQHLLPIRSIRYFLPVVEELEFAPVDQRYIDYLGRKLCEFLGRQVSLKMTVTADDDREAVRHRSLGRQLSLPW
jgi:hypothetical protein